MTKCVYCKQEHKNDEAWCPVLNKLSGGEKLPCRKCGKKFVIQKNKLGQRYCDKCRFGGGFRYGQTR